MKKVNEEFSKIPSLEQGKIYLINDIVQYEGMTQAPPLLTDASLITQMETCGKNIEDEDIKEALKRKRYRNFCYKSFYYQRTYHE